MVPTMCFTKKLYFQGKMELSECMAISLIPSCKVMDNSHNNEHREMRPKASSSVVEYPILIAYPSMYGMLKVCSVNDLHFRISSARVKSSL